MRAFLALDLPQETIDAFAGLQARLPVGRPVPLENLHLTLAFLDDQSEDALSDLHDELETLKAARFDLAFSGLDCFGGRSPKLLYVGAVVTPALEDLHRKITNLVRKVGIELPRERFRPHVTLARFGNGLSKYDTARLRGFMEVHAGATVPARTVTGFSLYRSTLRRQGALHEELARYPLE